MALASSAEAAIIYSGVQNITGVRNGSGYGGASVDIDGRGNRFGLTSHFGVFSASSGIGKVALFGSGSVRLLLGRVPSGAVISAGMPGAEYSLLRSRQQLRYSTPNGAHFTTRFSRGSWPDTANTGFEAIRFTEGGQAHAGWMRLKFSETRGFPNSLTAIDWAYNDVAGASIRAGQTSSVPEPGGKALALLAAGVIGLLAWRGHKRSLSAENRS